MHWMIVLPSFCLRIYPIPIDLTSGLFSRGINNELLRAPRKNCLVHQIFHLESDYLQRWWFLGLNLWTINFNKYPHHMQSLHESSWKPAIMLTIQFSLRVNYCSDLFGAALCHLDGLLTSFLLHLGSQFILYFGPDIQWTGNKKGEQEK